MEKYKTFEVRLRQLNDKSGSAQLMICSDTSEQKIYNKFLKMGVLADNFREIKLPSN